MSLLRNQISLPNRELLIALSLWSLFAKVSPIPKYAASPLIPFTYGLAILSFNSSNFLSKTFDTASAIAVVTARRLDTSKCKKGWDEWSVAHILDYYHYDLKQIDQVMRADGVFSSRNGHSNRMKLCEKVKAKVSRKENEIIRQVRSLLWHRYNRCIQSWGVFKKIGSHLIVTTDFCMQLYQRVIWLTRSSL